MSIDPEEVKIMSDKASKNPEELKLYEKNDYITAYGLHTDLRIERDGYQAAIGSNDKAGQGWEEHGKAQLNFLIHCGLKPEHTLLDFGCGTGRLACHAVPYLNPGNYTGVDISKQAIKRALSIAMHEKWGDKEPTFIVGDGSLMSVKDKAFNIIFSHSVLTHTPWDIAEALFKDLSEMAFGAFFFTYKRAEAYQRSGLKQFQYNPAELAKMARDNGLQAVEIDLTWPAGQKTMRVWREK